MFYYNRGLAYQKKGEQAKAEADFAKAKELGYESEGSAAIDFIAR